MATAIQKIILSSARDIPFNKLVLSQSNVRRVKAGVSVEELAESIARRGLIQSLHVRPVLDADGAETGMFEVPAGGRRYRALELLAKQKRLAKTAPVPCVVGDANSDILVDEVSLVENMERAPLLGHVSRVSFDRKDYRAVCLFQAARSAYPKSWRRAAWNKHLRGGCGILRCGISVASPSRGRLVDLLARLSAQHI